MKFTIEKVDKKQIKFFIVVFLFGFLMFQIGFLYGTKFYIPCEIRIIKNGNN